MQAGTSGGFCTSCPDAYQRILIGGPNGAKSAGKLSIYLIALTIANAVHQATWVRATSLPITAKKVYLAAAADRPGRRPERCQAQNRDMRSVMTSEATRQSSTGTHSSAVVPAPKVRFPGPNMTVGIPREQP